MLHRLRLTKSFFAAMILLAGCRPLLRAQTVCNPSTSPPNADNYFSIPEAVLAGEPFYEDVHICGVASGTSIRVNVAFVSGTTGLQVFANQGVTDINGVAPVSVSSGLPAGSYNLIFSSPDVPNLTTGPSSGSLFVQKGTATGAVNGLYVFLFQGVSAGVTDVGGAKQTHILGSFVADGKGKVTGGEADINSPQGVAERVPITGAYTVSESGRGTLSLTSSYGALQFSLSLGGTLSEVVPRFESGAMTSVAGGALTGTGSLRLADPAFQGGPLYSNTAVSLQGESACDSTCRGEGGFAAPFKVAGSLCLGCLPPSAAGGAELYRAVFNVVEGNSTKAGLVQTGSVGATDAFARSVVTATSGKAAGLPQRYAMYDIDSGTEYLLSLDPHSSASLVSGEASAFDHYH